MTGRRPTAIQRISRLFLTLAMAAGALWLAPLPQPALASPAPAPAAAPATAPVAAPRTSPASAPALGLLPAPAPTLLVTTATIADNPADGQCDLWEAMQAVFLADFDSTAAYHECTAALGGTNVIGFSPAVLGGTIQVPATVNSGNLPFVYGDTTLLGPVTIKPSATLTDTHLLRTAADANLSLIAVTLNGAHTSGGGAAILDLNHATVNLYGANITGNIADNDGGAINSDGNVNVVLSNFSGNEALGIQGGAGSGGAINITGAGTLSVAKSNFAGNTAKAGGGAIYSTVANATIEDSLFSGNLGGQDINLNKGGGAIYNDVNGAMAIARTQFAGNLAPQGNGGAVYNNAGAALVITDTTFAANLAGDPSHSTLGGGIYAQGLLTVFRSSFANNISVQGSGGALAIDSHGTTTVGNTTFVANGAPFGFGGAVVITQTQQGGPASTLVARNVTISTNAAPSGQGGGLYNGQGQNVDLGNTIVSGNQLNDCAGAGNYDHTVGHNLDGDNTCHLTGSGDKPSGSANLGGPSFNGGPIASMLTMKLQRPSDAIDAGDNTICAAQPVNNEDQRSNKRPVDGTSPGNLNPVCDMGAYEADGPKPGFGSDPSEPGPINVGNTQQGTTVNTTLVVSNTGDFLLTITPSALTGSNPGDFSVSPSVINIPVGGAPVNIVIGCTPSAIGSRSALMGMATTDVPLHAAVGYLLKCNGYAAPQSGFGSLPIAPGPIAFKDTLAFGGTSNASFKVLETGDATLHVTGANLTGPNAAEFQLLTPASFSIANGGAPQTVTVKCTPADYGLRTATLTFTTDDPTQASVNFALTCKGVPPPSPFLLGGTTMGNSPDHGLNGVYGLAVSPDSKHVYATSNLDGSISSFTRDLVTGALTFLGKDTPFIPFLPNYAAGARLLAVSPDNKNAIIAGETNNDLLLGVPNALTGELDTYPRGATSGSLGGAYGVAISPDGRHIYATGHNDNAVVVYSLDTAGHNLSYVQSVVSASNLGGPYGLAVSPDGQNVYVAGATNGTLEVLKRNASDGKLTHVQTRSPSDGIADMHGAIQVAVSPDGANVYLATLTDNAVVQFSRSSADGSLQWIGSFQCGCGAVDGLGGASGIDVTPDGLHVIADGYSGMAAVVFDRDPNTGVLTFHEEITKANTALPLSGARDLRISPDGKAVYVAAYLDDSIVVLPIANPVPFVNNISPASAPQGGAGFTLHIYGANFIPTSKVPGFTVSYISPNQLDLAVPASTLATSGPKFIQVENPQPIGDFGYSIPFYLQVIPPANHPIPAIDHISPQGQLPGGSGLTMDVYGTNFINGSTVLWNGAGRATTFIDNGHLQATIPQSDVSQPGVSSVTVTTGGPGGGTSNPVPFTVPQPGQNAIPTLTSINPLWVFSHGAASKQLQVTISGQNFIQGSTGQFNGVNRPTLFVDSSHLQVTLLGSDLAVPASTALTVFTPGPGGGTSNPLTFIIRKLYQMSLPVVRR